MNKFNNHTKKELTNEGRLKIIGLYNEYPGILIKEIEEKTGYSGVTIKNVLADYKNNLIDSKGFKLGSKIGERDGQLTETINPIGYVEKE